ncbi:hypothetical protein WJ09_24530 [Burkholderia vietnamiensis]|nr:hypothetical protein WJ09_24530 [Burkholderia vietnamiensis]
MTELRTIYNGEYGASEFFDERNLTYFVVLFQSKRMWRVVRTSDRVNAGKIFKNFSDRTEQLAKIDMQRIYVRAQNEKYQRDIELAQARMKSLQEDLEISRTQAANVAQRQQQARSEVTALQGAQAQSKRALRTWQDRAAQLQRDLEGMH